MWVTRDENVFVVHLAVSAGHGVDPERKRRDRSTAGPSPFDTSVVHKGGTAARCVCTLRHSPSNLVRWQRDKLVDHDWHHGDGQVVF